MRNRIKDSYRRIKQQEAEGETTANDKKEEYKKKTRKEGFMWGGGVTFLWAKYSHETKGTCPGVLRWGRKG